MSRILTIANEKGGVGKTTVATNLAVMARLAGMDVLLVDTDVKQTSITAWCGARQQRGVTPFIPAMIKVGKFGADVIAIAEKYDLVIVDVGGRDSTELRQGLAIADSAIVPIMPGQFEVWGMANMTATLDEVEDRIGRAVPTAVLLNGMSPHPSSTETREILDLLEGTSDRVPTFQTMLRSRRCYRAAIPAGLGAVELAGPARDAKANAELRSLYAEVFGEEWIAKAEQEPGEGHGTLPAAA